MSVVLGVRCEKIGIGGLRKTIGSASGVATTISAGGHGVVGLIARPGIGNVCVAM